jgi:peptide chain release factor 2
MVKDHRTKVESKNPEEVLDGNLDIFIEGWLRENQNANLKMPACR